MNKNYGALIQPNTKLFRNQFAEMCKLIGMNVKYQYPLSDKQYTTQGELKSSYSEPEVVSCILNDHTDHKTAKKLGWVVEVDEQVTVISLPYDLHELQIGCLVEIPSAFDGAPGRKFRITEMSSYPMYPASISCKLVPEYETEVEEAEIEQFVNTNFNLLHEGD